MTENLILATEISVAKSTIFYSVRGTEWDICGAFGCICCITYYISHTQMTVYIYLVCSTVYKLALLCLSFVYVYMLQSCMCINIVALLNLGFEIHLYS